MREVNKANLTSNNFLSQLLIFCGFIFSIIFVMENLKKSKITNKKNINPYRNNTNVKDISDVVPSEIANVVGKEGLAVKKNTITLTKFIEDNEKLINVLGIFTAITVFVSELRLQVFGYALSFMFMTLTIILWFELWGKFPSKSGDWKVIWFENILLLTIMAIFIYYLTDFRDIWHDYLFLFIFGLISTLFSIAMKRNEIFNKLFQTQTGGLIWLRNIFGIVATLIIIASSWLLAKSIAPILNNIFDLLNETLNNSF